MPRLILDADGLAGLRVALGREARSLRPVVYRPDTLGVTVSLPGPDWLARFLSLDGLDVFRSGRAIVARPTGSDDAPAGLVLGEIRDGLLVTLASLSERPDAGEPYTDLHLAAGVPSAIFARYLDDVLDAFRRSLPAAPRPQAPERPAHAPRTATERSREHRERRRSEERASAVWALAFYLDDEDAPEPGSRVSGSDLFEYVAEVLGYVVERFEETVLDPDPRSAEARLSREDRLVSWEEIRSDEWETPPPARPRSVSRRVLFEVAAAHGFTVTRPHGSVALRIPNREDDTVTVAEALIERAARMLLDESRDAIAAHLRAEEPSAPEALPVDVVSLDAFRARRSA